METPSLTAAVRGELLAHLDVTEGAHRFGGIVFHVGGRAKSVTYTVRQSRTCRSRRTSATS